MSLTIKNFISERYEYATFYFLLFFIVAANAFDALCTISWIESGLAVEANPLMAYLLERGHNLFFVVKMSVVCVATWILYLRRHFRLTRILVVPVSLVYAVVLMIHLSMIGLPG